MGYATISISVVLPVMRLNIEGRRAPDSEGHKGFESAAQWSITLE